MPISWINSQPARQQDPIARTLASTRYGERMRERTMTEHASQLEAAMHEIRRESRRLGYVPTRFRQMLNKQGALVTAHQLLAFDHRHKGFTRLWDLCRLDLSLECVVLKPAFRALFTGKELNVARCRLRKLDFDPTPSLALAALQFELHQTDRLGWVLGRPSAAQVQTDRCQLAL